MTAPLLLCAGLALMVSGCTGTTRGLSAAALQDAVTPNFIKSARYSDDDKECMARAMFFESNRSSRDGMIAVGTVVMNRKRSGQYPDTVCGVVSQKGQFAPGVMTRRMDPMPDVEEAAEAVLKGERNPKLKNAMHFHTAGMKFRYKNMHYVTVAGGNSFYEKRGRRWQPLPDEDGSVMMASASTDARTTGTVARLAPSKLPTETMALAEPVARPTVASTAITAAQIKAPTAITAAQIKAPAAMRAQITEVALPSDAPLPSFQQPLGKGPADIDPARFQ